MADRASERTPLLNDGTEEQRELIEFSKEDPENPRAWPNSKKLLNVFIIALMAILSPLASSMFGPGIMEIAEDLNTTVSVIVVAQSGFVIMLGIGPLIWAPLSETFGRRTLYMICFGTFAVLQIPTALSVNVEMLIVVRTIAGFFGSVGIANGGGTISDMYLPSKRAGVFGWYLLGPLLGPTLGPLFGGVIVEYLGWRWMFWIMTIVSTINVALGFIFLKESYAPVLLARRKRGLEAQGEGKFYFEGEDLRPLRVKLAHSMFRPIKILCTQPIVITMASYQALIFATTYSIYTNMENIYGGEYGFTTSQVGLLYLGPGLGFLTAVRFLVPRIDTVYNYLAKKHGNEGRPEYRLPLANIGAFLLPASLFCFGWAVEYHLHWFVTILPTYFYGMSQIVIFNTVQNYYIDSFEKFAASAIAAGTVFRSLVGGVVPLFAPSWFDDLGYGWGISIFAFVGVALAPSPVLFYYFGPYLRERFAIEL